MSLTQASVNHTTHDNADATLASAWLTRLESGLQRAEKAAVAALFDVDCHWRDLFAFTWSITPSEGIETISSFFYILILTDFHFMSYR